MSRFNCPTQELNFKMSKWHSLSTSDPLQVLTNKLLKEMKLFDLAERWKNLGLTGEKITNFSGITIFSFRYSAIAENKMPKDEKRI